MWKKIIFINILLLIIYATIIWNISIKQMKDLCENISIAMPIEVVKTLIEEKSLLSYSDMNFDGANILIIRSASNYGRYTGSIYYKNNKVLKTDYVFLD